MLNLGLPNCMFLSKSPIKCPEGTLHFPKNDSSVRVSIGMASFTFLMLLCNLFSHSLRPLQKLEWIQTLLVTSLWTIERDFPLNMDLTCNTILSSYSPDQNFGTLLTIFAWRDHFRWKTPFYASGRCGRDIPCGSVTLNNFPKLIEKLNDAIPRLTRGLFIELYDWYGRFGKPNSSMS